MRGLIDQMAAESRSKYGRSIDLALFTEYAVTAGKPGPAAEVAVPLDDTIIEALGSKAREHNTYIVFGGVFLDDPATARLLQRRRRDRPPGPAGRPVCQGPPRAGSRPGRTGRSCSKAA